MSVRDGQQVRHLAEVLDVGHVAHIAFDQGWM